MTSLLLRTGVDMVDISRLSRMIEISGEAFVESAWTAEERLYCAGRPERLASRWAAKEAAMKALGQGVGTISPLEVEVNAIEGECPTLVLHGQAARQAKRLNLDVWSVSLAHEGGWALAFVVAAGGISDA